MNPFTFSKVKDSVAAVKIASEDRGARFLGGGTNLIDLMKMNIEQPDKLIDIAALPLKKIQVLGNGNIMIGALVTNTELAYHESIKKNFPLLSQAILSGASAQLRNRATTAGNILQRTRCYYFYDIHAPCNKREPGSGCSAINGYNRIHAVLGTSDYCVATHPSDMCVAMTALDAIVHVQGVKGERAIPFTDFHTLPGDHPEIENVLVAGDLITGVEIPALSFAKNAVYLKVRDRASYDFALTSAGVMMDVHAGVINDVRIALGGVGTKPWRCREAEQLLKGKPASVASFQAAADITMKNAKELKYNFFKTKLVKQTLIGALQETGGML